MGIIQELKDYKYIPQNDDRNDHMADAMRYFFINNPPEFRKGVNPWPYIIAGFIIGAILAIVSIYILF